MLLILTRIMDGTVEKGFFIARRSNLPRPAAPEGSILSIVYLNVSKPPMVAVAGEMDPSTLLIVLL